MASRQATRALLMKTHIFAAGVDSLVARPGLVSGTNLCTSYPRSHGVFGRNGARICKNKSTNLKMLYPHFFTLFSVPCEPNTTSGHSFMDGPLISNAPAVSKRRLATESSAEKFASPFPAVPTRGRNLSTKSTKESESGNAAEPVKEPNHAAKAEVQINMPAPLPSTAITAQTQIAEISFHSLHPRFVSSHCRRLSRA